MNYLFPYLSIYSFLFIFLMSESTIFAQETFDSQTMDSLNTQQTKPQKKRLTQFGMNVTPLLMQLLPLNRGTNRTGPIDLLFKRINNQTLWAFRLAAGVNIDVEDEINSHVNLRLGFEKRIDVGKNMYMQTGMDVVGFAGSFNTPAEQISDNTQVGIGIAPILGFEYNITQNISLSTETALFIGTATEAPFYVHVISPTSVFLNVRF